MEINIEKTEADASS